MAGDHGIRESGSCRSALIPAADLSTSGSWGNTSGVETASHGIDCLNEAPFALLNERFIVRGIKKEIV